MKLKIDCDLNGKFFIKKRYKFLPFWFTLEENYYGVETYHTLEDAEKRIRDIIEMEEKRKLRYEKAKNDLKKTKIYEF